MKPKTIKRLEELDTLTKQLEVVYEGIQNLEKEIVESELGSKWKYEQQVYKLKDFRDLLEIKINHLRKMVRLFK